MMNTALHTLPYPEYEKEVPQTGTQIIAQFDEQVIVVYQAFNADIADYAIREQRFGGPAYKKGRMTWIKPNFLWMMFRAGWASKVNQERILAIRLPHEFFLDILAGAVHSSYDPSIYGSETAWRERLASSDVRLQWDPDHDPYGNKLERRAIQLGLRGAMAERFNQALLGIEDITPFVLAQHARVRAQLLYELLVPREAVYPLPPAMQASLGAQIS